MTAYRTTFILAILLWWGPTSGFAEGGLENGRGLERRAWWPFAEGPHYGDVTPSMRFDARVVRLPVGSFDTRGAGLNLPRALRMSGERAATANAPWLVQLEGPITEAKKDVLRGAGAELYYFYPSNTFLVRAPDPTRLAGLPGVLWAGPYHPGYRIEPWLGTGRTLDPLEAENSRISLRVRLFEAGERAGIIARLVELGATIDRASTFHPSDRPTHVYFDASPDVIATIAKDDAVRWVEETGRGGFTMNAETKVVMQSGFIDNGTPYWDAGVDGSTQLVTVMDSGLDVDTILLSHTELDAGTPGPSHRKVHAYTPYGGGNTATCAGFSGYSHGTNSSQCAVANREDFGLNGNLEGIAHGARLIFQDIAASDFLSCVLGFLSPPDSLLAAYAELTAAGGHLFNGSFSICEGATYGSDASDADQYAWDNKDFLSFYSGGNGGVGLVCPGTNKNNVGSGGHYQDPNTNLYYGAVGPAPDDRLGPTVLGPACDIPGGNPAPFDFDTSTSIQSNDDDITGLPTGDAGISQGSCGTSFSSPWLMGAAALIHDYFEKGFHPSGQANPSDGFPISGALAKAVLINAGEYIDNLDCNGPCDNPLRPGLMGSMGMGKVNLSLTLPLDGDARTVPGARVVDNGMSDGLVTSETVDEVIEVTDAAVPFRATLVWTDREGSLLTNDLRLTVIGPAGDSTQTYYGNNFNAGEFSVSEANGGTTDDHTNVMESVRIDPAELVTGEWTVRVTGTNVPMGDPNFNDTQPYALIVTGGFDSLLGPGEVSPVGSSEPLVVTATDATTVSWQWENLNDPAVVYQMHRGTLAALAGGTYDHGMIDNANCTLAGNGTTLSDKTDLQDSYYLVGARKAGIDGTLGDDSAGNERPAAAPACP